MKTTEKTLLLPLRAAFTLVELAVVLVIIGLIVGAILVGQDLLRASKIRGVINELTQYSNAYSAFRLKYGCAPGDCADITSVVSGAVNGNGDGYICTAMDVYTPCTYQAWYQLSQTGFIGGNYTGSGTNHLPVIGTNIPTSVIAPTVGVAMTGGAGAWGRRGNVLIVASLAPSDGGYYGVPNANKFYGPALSAPESYNLDKKIDDGTPYGGHLFAVPDRSNISPYDACHNGNVNGSPPFTASYYTNVDDTPRCKVYYDLPQ